MATSLTTLRRNERDELAGVEQWYRDELARPAQLPKTQWSPVRVGPTWQTDGGHWVLPEHTLGWQVLAWCGHWLQESRGTPWQFTLEQARFLLHWYAVNEAGQFLYRDGVLQRLKGWGKDPIGACLCLAETLGPVRVRDWDRNGPVGGDVGAAWVQTAATSKDQTKNTMRLIPGLVSPEARKKFGLQVGKEHVYALGDERFLQAVTSSPATLQGARSTFVLMNEALALDTPLPTPDGWTVMDSVQAGDLLVGSDGQPVKVIYVTEDQIGRDCYRVTLADGTSVIASDGHLWQTKVSESAAKPKVRTTAEMVEDGRRFRVPRAGALDLPDIPLPVDPYVLGLWLGDGSTQGPNITASADDVDEAEALVRARGFTTKRCKYQEGRAPRFQISVEGARRNRNDFRTVLSLHAQLDEAGLLGNKHVPDIYLRAGTEQRRALLRGLMDSDGCVSKLGLCIFVNSNDQIADAMMELLRSLGQAPRRAWTTDARSRGGGYHRITFTPRQLQPFVLSRKSAAVKPASVMSDWISIKSIAPIDSVPVKCIEVDAADHLFLAGEGWTVTHNTHEWVESNQGHEMAMTISNNVTKSSDGAARTLRITNAYEPGEDSVAERDREQFEKVQSGEYVDTGLLYDSLEAPPEAPLSEEAAPSVVESIRGDSVWLATSRIVSSILDGRNPPSQSRRFWYNQIVAAEDAWADPLEWDACAAPDKFVLADDKIVAFFDGSKSDDTTGLVGCRLSDGHLFVIGAWAKPPGDRGKGWIVDRAGVNAAVESMFASYKVVGFFADPSDTRDDDGERFWEPMIDDWHRQYGPQLQVWATQAGDRRHSISWDMRNRMHVEAFTLAAGRFLTEMATRGFTHDGSGMLRQHIRNARRRTNNHGVSFGKEHRESARKVDLAVCAVGASMLRRLMLNKDTGTKQRTGKVW
jgi:hypothetical protein